MKSLLICSILMALVSTGLCFKCYVGTGDVGDDLVTEVDGFKSCLLSVAETGGITVAARSGSLVEMEEGCDDASVMGVSTRTCVCNSELCNNAPAATALDCEGCFKCYVGPGDVGDALVTEEDGFKSCVLTVAEASGQEAKVRSGSTTELDEGCESGMLYGVDTTTCNCNSELCNNAPATAQALMPILAVAMLVKLMF